MKIRPIARVVLLVVAAVVSAQAQIFNGDFGCRISKDFIIVAGRRTGGSSTTIPKNEFSLARVIQNCKSGCSSASTQFQADYALSGNDYYVNFDCYSTVTKYRAWPPGPRSKRRYLSGGLRCKGGDDCGIQAEEATSLAKIKHYDGDNNVVAERDAVVIGPRHVLDWEFQPGGVKVKVFVGNRLDKMMEYPVEKRIEFSDGQELFVLNVEEYCNNFKPLIVRKVNKSFDFRGKDGRVILWQNNRIFEKELNLKQNCYSRDFCSRPGIFGLRDYFRSPLAITENGKDYLLGYFSDATAERLDFVAFPDTFFSALRQHVKGLEVKFKKSDLKQPFNII